MMERYQLIKKVFGGSDVYDSTGKQVAYSLPSIIGDGEDFYDMNGKSLGQSFESAFGGENFKGIDGSYGFMDEEIMMGRNLYLHGELEDKAEKLESWETPDVGNAFSDPFKADDLSSDSDNLGFFDDL